MGDRLCFKYGFKAMIYNDLSGLPGKIRGDKIR